MSFKFTIDTTQVVKGLEALSEKAKDAAYAGAQAAAQVMYEEAKMRANDLVSDKPHYFNIEGRKYGPFQPGTLRDSIYQARSKDRSTGYKAVYHVSWNFKKAPYGFMLEFGNSRSGAHPFLRPAYEAVKDESIAAAKAAFVEKMK